VIRLYAVLLRTLVTRGRVAVFLAAGGLLDLIATESATMPTAMPTSPSC
jgi:hypothetical protein